MNKTLVYTVIFGNKDTAPYLINPDLVPSAVTLVCYTDNPNLTSEDYKIVYIKRPLPDATRSSRKLKICGPDDIDSFQTAIWHDSSVALHGGKIQELIDFASNYTISMFLHDETCSYSEARTCIKMQKDNPLDIVRQMATYAIRNSYPTRNGVYETTIMVMNVKRYFKSSLQLKWWSHLNRFSKRDQLSFPLVKVEYNVQVGIINGRGHENPYSEHKGHIFDLDNDSLKHTFYNQLLQKVCIWIIFRLELFVNSKKT